jgi:hypothetical protein
MECSLRYGRDRFARARASLEGRTPTALGKFPNTSNNRLRAAVLAVYACVRGHFANAADHAEFADLMFELRLRDPSGRMLRAIDAMNEDECVRYGRRLYELSRRVEATPVPSDRFAAARASGTDARQQRRG